MESISSSSHSSTLSSSSSLESTSTSQSTVPSSLPSSSTVSSFQSMDSFSANGLKQQVNKSNYNNSNSKKKNIKVQLNSSSNSNKSNNNNNRLISSNNSNNNNYSGSNDNGSVVSMGDHHSVSSLSRALRDSNIHFDYPTSSDVSSSISMSTQQSEDYELMVRNSASSSSLQKKYYNLTPTLLNHPVVIVEEDEEQDDQDEEEQDTNSREAEIEDEEEEEEEDDEDDEELHDSIINNNNRNVISSKISTPPLNRKADTYSNLSSTPGGESATPPSAKASPILQPPNQNITFESISPKLSGKIVLSPSLSSSSLVNSNNQHNSVYKSKSNSFHGSHGSIKSSNHGGSHRNSKQFVNSNNLNVLNSDMVPTSAANLQTLMKSNQFNLNAESNTTSNNNISANTINHNLNQFNQNINIITIGGIQIDRSTPVNFNVGGTIFATSLNTILKASQSILYKIVEMQIKVVMNEDTIFIDRNPNYFSCILDFLRTNRYIPPVGINPKGLLLEAEFFRIDVLAQLIRDEPELTRSEIIQIINTSYDYPRFRGLWLCRTNLSGLDLSLALFEYSNLSRSTFATSLLQSTSFAGSNLDHTTFQKNTGSNGRFTLAKIRNASLINNTFYEWVAFEADFSNTVLTGTTFACSDLSGSKFLGADLRGCDLSHCNLSHCDFTGAIFDNTSNLSCTVTKDTIFEKTNHQLAIKKKSWKKPKAIRQKSKISTIPGMQVI